MRTIGIIVTAAALAGCGSKEKPAETGGNVASIQLTDGNGQTMTMTAAQGDDSTVRINLGGGQGGATITTGGGWPAGLAAVAPAYPGAEVTGSFAGAGPDGGGGTVSFSTGDDPGKVIDFYKARATAAGLSVGMNADAGGSRMFTASDEKTGRSMTVTAAAEGGKTTGSILYGAGKH